MRRRLSVAKKYTYLSLFSGCGGFDDGFEKNGYQCVGAYDIDDSVIDVYKKNLAGPITKLDLSVKKNRKLDFKPGEIDVIISGSPCQGFSTAGKREVNDPRNQLLLAGGEIAIALQPKIFVAENVMGSLSGEHYKYWMKMERDFDAAGYHTKFLKIDCTKIGLPQMRKRVILIASKEKGHSEIELVDQPTRNLQNVLKDISELPNQNDFFPIRKDHLKVIKTIKPGQKLCDVRGGSNSIHSWEIPEAFGKVSIKEKKVLEAIMLLRRRIRQRDFGDADPVSLSSLSGYLNFDPSNYLKPLLEKGYVRKIGNKIDLVKTFNGLYRRMEWTKPSYTVDTRFGNPRYFIHPDEDRGFTVREAARIQGFRDDYIFSGSISDMFKMIGNAVPPLLSDIIAQNLTKKLNGVIPR